MCFNVTYVKVITKPLMRSMILLEGVLNCINKNRQRFVSTLELSIRISINVIFWYNATYFLICTNVKCQEVWGFTHWKRLIRTLLLLCIVLRESGLAFFSVYISIYNLQKQSCGSGRAGAGRGGPGQRTCTLGYRNFEIFSRSSIHLEQRAIKTSFFVQICDPTTALPTTLYI